MILLNLVLLAIILAIVVVLYTQVLKPFLDGTPMWPQFRQSPLRQEVTEAEERLAEVTEEVILTERLNEINRRKAELESKK